MKYCDDFIKNVVDIVNAFVAKQELTLKPFDHVFPFKVHTETCSFEFEDVFHDMATNQPPKKIIEYNQTVENLHTFRRFSYRQYIEGKRPPIKPTQKELDDVNFLWLVKDRMCSPRKILPAVKLIHKVLKISYPLSQNDKNVLRKFLSKWKGLDNEDVEKQIEYYENTQKKFTRHSLYVEDLAGFKYRFAELYPNEPLPKPKNPEDIFEAYRMYEKLHKKCRKPIRKFRAKYKDWLEEEKKVEKLIRSKNNNE